MIFRAAPGGRPFAHAHGRAICLGMKQIVALALSALMTLPAAAADAPAPEIFVPAAQAGTLDSYRWTHRPVLVFADSPADPRYVQQMNALRDEVDALRDRDVVVITDTDPAARSDLRQQLRPRGFALVLVGKDGQIKLRKPSPWQVRELSRVIDKMPMRQQEIRDRRAAQP